MIVLGCSSLSVSVSVGGSVGVRVCLRNRYMVMRV